MLTKGARVPDIAVYLNISAKTVNTYRYRMFEKLNVSTDVELTHLALRNKLILLIICRRLTSMSISTDEPFDHQAFLKNLTNQPGVYRMYNQKEEVIYVGKAKNLKKRVASYFRSTVDSIKTRSLVKQICEMDVTVVHSEAEAFILENNYIKKYKPRYNVLLRDDKSYPFIFLSDHTHPRLSNHRGPKNSKGEYFGPYPSAWAVRESLRTMQRLFPIRQCEDSYYRARTRPCLQYQLQRCAGPCVEGLVSEEEYSHKCNTHGYF